MIRIARALFACALTTLAQGGSTGFEQTMQPGPTPRLRVPPGVFPVGPGVAAPVAMYTDSPDYTDEARLAELEGTVWVAAVIGTDGRVRDLQVTRSIGLGLEGKAMDAMRHWQFRPGMHEGKEVDIFVVLPVTFVLPSKHSRWHLVGLEFDPDDGASRPQFRSVT